MIPPRSNKKNTKNQNKKIFQTSKKSSMNLDGRNFGSILLA
jgi:hypothetical protein